MAIRAALPCSVEPDLPLALFCPSLNKEARKKRRKKAARYITEQRLFFVFSCFLFSVYSFSAIKSPIRLFNFAYFTIGTSSELSRAKVEQRLKPTIRYDAIMCFTIALSQILLPRFDCFFGWGVGVRNIFTTASKLYQYKR